MEFDVPQEIAVSQLDLLGKVSKKGKIKIGVNEVTKAIEREKALVVFIAKDVSPKELVMHLPLLCIEKKIPYSFVETKKDLGTASGIEVGTSSIAVMEDGGMKKELEGLTKKLAEINPALNKAPAKKTEAPKEKPEEKPVEAEKEKQAEAVEEKPAEEKVE